MRFVWFVCESGNRWHRAIGHFGPQMLPDAEDFLNVRRIARPESCRAAIAQQSPAVVLWELPPEDAGDVLKTIDHTARMPNKPLQFVALSAQANLTEKARTDVELALRELGAAGVLAQPLSLAGQVTAVRRYWRQNRRGDNLSIVRQIWDRLPWSGNA